MYCRTEIEAVGISRCGDCQARVRDAVSQHPSILEIPSDLRFIKRFGAGCHIQDLAGRLGIAEEVLVDLVDLVTGSSVGGSRISVTRLGTKDVLGPVRIDPAEIARFLCGFRKGVLVPSSSREAILIRQYPELGRQCTDIDFLRTHSEEGCTSLELANQLEMPRVTLLGLIKHKRLKASLKWRACGSRRNRTWVISPKEIARVIVTYRYRAGVFELAKSHKGIIDYYTLLGDVRAGRFGRRYTTLTGALAIHADEAENIVTNYLAIREDKTPLNLGVESPYELTINDLAAIFGCAVPTAQARVVKDGIPHKKRGNRFIFKWADIVDFCQKVIEKEVAAGSAINPTSARRVLERFSRGFSRELIKPS